MKIFEFWFKTKDKEGQETDLGLRWVKGKGEEVLPVAILRPNAPAVWKEATDHLQERRAAQ